MAKTSSHKPHGASHFLQERVSSAALGLLAPVFAVLLVWGNDGSLETLRAWLSNPLNAWVSAAFLFVSVWHMMMGLDVIIDDYIGKPGVNGLLKTINYAVSIAAAAGGLWSIYSILTSPIAGA
jgi:succinate dehydrogenase / fumarate reductase, membrane anchor subunit